MECRSRREVLYGIGSLSTLGVLTGCLGAGGSGGSSDGGTPTGAAGRSPTETVRTFNEAIRNGNTDRAQSLLHPDGGIEVQGVDALSIQGLSAIGRSGSEATVDVALEGDRSLHVILRKHDGEWKLYGSE